MEAKQTPERLRYEAHLAYLDGRVKRARELNRRADDLSASKRLVAL